MTTNPPPLNVWLLTEQLEARKTTHAGRLWFSDPQNSAWTRMVPVRVPQPVALPALPETIYGLSYESGPDADSEGYQELIDAPGYTSADMRAYARAALAAAGVTVADTE